MINKMIIREMMSGRVFPLSRRVFLLSRRVLSIVAALFSNCCGSRFIIFPYLCAKCNKMRRLIFSACFVLMVATIIASLDSYRTAEAFVRRDLDQALLLTMEMKSVEYITPDTVRTYRSFIRTPMLRQSATLSYCLPDEKRTTVCSRKLMMRHGGRSYYLRGYANCSMATVLSLSDMRLPGILMMLTLLSLLLGFSPLARRRQRDSATTLMPASSTAVAPAPRGLCYIADSHDFCLDGRAVHFTPMQRQLMELFYQSDRRTLTKQEICDALWPRKDDPSETLYTLIKRLKQTLSDNGCPVQIVSDRGRAYRLDDTHEED